MKLHMEILRLGDQVKTILDIDDVELTMSTLPLIKPLVQAALASGATVSVNGVAQT